jgi:hypothetical protein
MNATEEGYNGWSNRETWCVALWINNDQGWQESVHEAIRDRAEHGYRDEQPAGGLLAWQAGEAIKENVQEVMYGTGELPTSGLASDLLGYALDAQVNWDELGAAFLTDLAEVDS